MPQVEQARPVVRHKRYKAAIVVVGVVVIMIVATGYYFYWRLVPSASTTVAAADKLDAEGSYTQAFSELQSAYSRAIYKSDKILLLSRLAATSADMSNNQQALQYFQQLNQLQPNNYSTLMNVGNLAVQQGNKQAALAAYQQALTIRKSQKPGMYWQDDINQLDQTIAGLQS
jgi:tetratricopeptide (TPR) repeat protein